MRAAHEQPKTVAPDAILDPSPVRSDAAQRQWLYRQRRKRAVTDAIGNEAAASRVTLVALLAHELACLEAHTTPPRIDPTRNSARRILKEIITRYGIELEL
jgi:hypothetical protein